MPVFLVDIFLLQMYRKLNLSSALDVPVEFYNSNLCGVEMKNLVFGFALFLVSTSSHAYSLVCKEGSGPSVNSARGKIIEVNCKDSKAIIQALDKGYSDLIAGGWRDQNDVIKCDASALVNFPQNIVVQLAPNLLQGCSGKTQLLKD